MGGTRGTRLPKAHPQTPSVFSHFGAHHKFHPAIHASRHHQSAHVKKGTFFELRKHKILNEK
jgi:hypothetical protein